MGVAAARRLRVSGSVRQSYRSRGAASQRTRGIARVPMVPGPTWISDRQKTLWDRIQDDGELIGLKTVLLATLLLLTVLLEWVA